MYQNYRLYMQKVLAVKTVGNIDSHYFEKKWTPTKIKFRGRNHKEAMRKATAFWRDGEFGMGRIRVVLESTPYREFN